MNNTSTTSVAVILVNYNSLNDTNECIKSLSNSTIKPFIVVIDNGSADASVITEQLVTYNLGFELLLLPENIGFGRANNAGIQWLQLNNHTDYIFLLNNDTIVQPSTIEKLIDSFGKDERIGLTTCKIMFSHDPKLVWYGGGELNLARGNQKAVDFGKEANENGANKSRYVTFASGCAMMFKYDVLAQLKGFDDRFFMYIEDFELSLRLQRLLYKIWYNADTYILHKVHGSLGQSPLPAFHPKNPNLSFYAYHFVKNTMQTMQKHLSKFQYFVFLLNYTPYLLKHSAKFIINGKLGAVGQFGKAIRDSYKRD